MPHGREAASTAAPSLNELLVRLSFGSKVYDIQGLYRGLYRDNGKENGNHYSIIGYICWG